MKSSQQMKRYLMREVHSLEIPRKPPQRASTLHAKPWRSYPYRRWIKSLPSAVSGLTPCDPCHTGAHGFGQKASDLTCIPLTREEHDAFDKDPAGYAKLHGLDVKALVKRLNRAWFNQWKVGNQ